MVVLSRLLIMQESAECLWQSGGFCFYSQRFFLVLCLVFVCCSCLLHVFFSHVDSKKLVIGMVQRFLFQLDSSRIDFFLFTVWHDYSLLGGYIFYFVHKAENRHLVPKWEKILPHIVILRRFCRASKVFGRFEN